MKAYYKVTPGPTFDILKEWEDKHFAAHKAACHFAASHDSRITVVRGTRVVFEDGVTPDPKVWKKAKHEGYTPQAKSVEGASLLKELKALPADPGSMDIVFALIGASSLDMMRVNQTGTPGLVKKKGEAFYRLHIDDYWLPEDRAGLKEILASEYYAEAKDKPTEAESMRAWIGEHSDALEREWQHIHEEYGDSAPLLSAFKAQRWWESLESMRKFLGISKPSQALQAMVDGLRATKDKHDGYTEVVDMTTYGKWSPISDVCYGCAATYALRALCPVDGEFEMPETMAQAKEDASGVSAFEWAIECARQGQLKRLFAFFNVPPDTRLKTSMRWALYNDTWEAQLPKVEETIKDLQARGI
jgi:hypothetical protein